MAGSKFKWQKAHITEEVFRKVNWANAHANDISISWTQLLYLFCIQFISISMEELSGEICIFALDAYSNNNGSRN